MPPTRTGPRRLVLLCSAGVLAEPVVVDPGALDPHLPLRFLLVSVALLAGLLARSVEVGPTRLLEQVPRSLMVVWMVVAITAVDNGSSTPSHSRLFDDRHS